jgi:hypothetical protein
MLLKIWFGFVLSGFGKGVLGDSDGLAGIGLGAASCVCV